MKIKRQKRVQNILKFYKRNYGFREPYQVLIDGTFCKAALAGKVTIKDQIPKYFQSEIKFLTTKCVIMETESLGPQLYGATLIAKQFAIHKCAHNTSKVVPAAECLYGMVQANGSGSQHYMIATQDAELRSKVRALSCVPILYMRDSVPLMEKPSMACKNAAKQTENAKCDLQERERVTLEKLKKQEGCVDNKLTGNELKKRKRKGPNPLSCLPKKKKKPAFDRPPRSDVESDQSKVNRKRKRNKVPSRLKEAVKPNVE